MRGILIGLWLENIYNPSSLGSPTNIGTSSSEAEKNESGGIYEFRHLKASVPLDEWPDVADEANVLERDAKRKEKAQKEAEAAREAEDAAAMGEWMSTTFE